MNKIACVVRSLLLAALAVSLTGANWPTFRGPGGTASSDDRGLPETWNATENVIWKSELPGYGTSSPITWENRIFLTCYNGYGLDEAEPGEPEGLRRFVLCLDRASGRIVWQREAQSELPDQDYSGYIALHGYASSTPATDGKTVFAFFGKSGVFAFDVAGKPKWRADVGSGTHNWGSASSPVLFENLVIVNAAVESQSLVALDVETGKEVWRADDIHRAWGTPVIGRAEDGSHEMALAMSGRVVGFDPATGEELWTCDEVEDYICPSIVAAEGIFYITGGRSGTARAIRAGGRGDVTESHVLWSQNVKSNVPSPVLYQGNLYWVNDKGQAACVDAATGELVYRERLPRSGRVYASVVAADDKIFAVSREAGTFVLAAGTEFQELAQNDLSPDDSIFNATPAISNGQLLLRSNRYLYCIGKKD